MTVSISKFLSSHMAQESVLSRISHTNRLANDGLVRQAPQATIEQSYIISAKNLASVLPILYDTVITGRQRTTCVMQTDV